jgi:hypothetical protein
MRCENPTSPELLRAFKNAGGGHPRREAGEMMISAILAHYKYEITVYTADLQGELFRIGSGDRHEIKGVHVHPAYIKKDSWEFRASSKATKFLTDKDFNMYLGILLQALELGRFRVGYPDRKEPAA